VLEALRPPGEIKPIEHLPPMPIWPEGLVHELGEQRAIIVLRDVLRDAVSGWRTVASQPWQIRKLLGASLIERIRQSTPATAPEQSAKKRGERKDAK
jgi:hypothetical protein